MHPKLFAPREGVAALLLSLLAACGGLETDEDAGRCEASVLAAAAAAGEAETDPEGRGGAGVIEGDIVASEAGPAGRPGPGAVPFSSQSTGGEAGRWPGGVVPYVISAEVEGPERIRLALERWAARTAIRFTPRDGEADYVEFGDDGSGACRSAVGRQGGRQPLQVSPRCSVGNLLHEVGHAVGLIHEHTRPDRDRFVAVLWDNIAAGFADNFRRRPAGGFPGMPYDFASVMNYGSRSFSKNGMPTLVRRDCTTFAGQRGDLSAGDVARVSALYPPAP